MKIISLTVLGALMIGCGGGGGKPDKPEEPAAIIPPKASPAFKDDFKAVVCTELDSKDDDCDGLLDDGFDLSKNNAIVLSAPEDIGTSQYFYFDGKRVGLVPKEEKDISPVNMLAQGLALLEGEPSNYKDAQAFLKKHGITGTDDQNKAIMHAINHNLELLGEQGVPLKLAYDAAIKAMAEALVNLTVKEPSISLSGLTSDPVRICIQWDLGSCVKWASGFTKAQLDSDDISPEIFLLDRHDAEKIALETREKSDKPNAIDGVFKELECKENEDKHIYMYGVYDDYASTNPEPSTLSAGMITALAPQSQYLSAYDEPANHPNVKIFADTLGGLPTNLTQGVYAIGLKEGGFRFTDIPVFLDTYIIGDATGTEKHEGNVSTLRSTWVNPATNVYSKNLSAIMTTNGQSLLARLQGGQNFLDTATMMTTTVDFIAIATCEPKPKPVGTPIKEIPTKLECNLDKGEELFTVWGGTSDNFAQPEDATTPSAGVVALQGNNEIRYDTIIKKIGKFGDTLSHPNSYISQLEVLVNTRPSPTAPGSVNDMMFLGDMTNQIGTQHSPNSAGIATPNGGTAHIMYGGTATQDANGNAAGTLLSLMNTNNTDLDVLVFDQTEVDTIRLSMCVIKDYQEPCPEGDADGDGVCDKDDCDPEDPSVWVGCDDDNNTEPTEGCNQKVSLDLRPATSWVDTAGNNPTENNVFSTYPPNPNLANKIWDGDMNWFDYGSAGNTVHPLSLDFCACGDTYVTIDELKSDNFSKIYLDTDPTPASYSNPAYIAYRSNGTSQDTMASWGSSVSGYLQVPFTGTTPINHRLHFDVKNGFGPSGGAVNGKLEFTGHLGKCVPTDTVGTEVDDDTILVNPDHNWTVVTEEGVVAVITDITFVDDPGAPVGTEGNDTIVIGVAGPLIATNPGGKPYIDNDPEVVVSVGDLERVELSAGALVAIDHLINPPEYTRDDNTSIVTDHGTGLQWQDDEAAKTVLKQWTESANYGAGDFMNTSGDTATTYCDALTLGGHTDWRLPSRSELEGIVDHSTSYPSINTSVFDNTAYYQYWSSTTPAPANYTSRVWVLYFGHGSAYHANKSDTMNVRCVR